MKKPRRNHSALFKAQVAREAIRGEKTVAKIDELTMENSFLEAHSGNSHA